jgi:hypothetical protein
MIARPDPGYSRSLHAPNALRENAAPWIARERERTSEVSARHFMTSAAKLKFAEITALGLSLALSLRLCCSGLEQLNWIAVRIFQLDLLAAWAYLHLITKMESSLP